MQRLDKWTTVMLRAGWTQLAIFLITKARVNILPQGQTNSFRISEQVLSFCFICVYPKFVNIERLYTPNPEIPTCTEDGAAADTAQIDDNDFDDFG